MRDGSRVFFQEQLRFSPGVVAEIASVTSFSTVPGDGSAASASFYQVGSFTVPRRRPAVARRQPRDGRVLRSVREPGWSTSSTARPARRVSQGVIPYGGGNNSPRFLPDSSGLYLVDPDGEGVDRYDPDGTNASTLFTPPAEHGFLKDFVLAPNGDDYAYVATRSSLAAQKPNAGHRCPESTRCTSDRSPAGSGRVVNLGVNSFYDELIFHPDGQHVFLDSYQTDVLMFAAADAHGGARPPRRRDRRARHQRRRRSPPARGPRSAAASRRVADRRPPQRRLAAGAVRGGLRRPESAARGHPRGPRRPGRPGGCAPSGARPAWAAPPASADVPTIVYEEPGT